jgi:hypothetical protein
MGRRTMMLFKEYIQLIRRTKENRVMTLHETNEASLNLISNRTETHDPCGLPQDCQDYSPSEEKSEKY